MCCEVFAYRKLKPYELQEENHLIESAEKDKQIERMQIEIERLKEACGELERGVEEARKEGNKEID